MINNDLITISTDEKMDIIETVIGVASNDPVSMAHLGNMIISTTITNIQKIPYIKLQKYFEGVKRVEDNYSEACKLSDKLFSHPEKKIDNAMRVFNTVISVDTEKKTDYLINATKSLLLKQIEIDIMFRFFYIIENSLPEDLEYLKSNIEKSGSFTGNMHIWSLAQNGLMISAGFDMNADIEKQQYHITSLGYMFDQYVLSFDDSDRLNWHKKRNCNIERKYSAPVASEQDVKYLSDKIDETKENDSIMSDAYSKWTHLKQCIDNYQKSVDYAYIIWSGNFKDNYPLIHQENPENEFLGYDALKNNMDGKYRRIYLIEFNKISSSIEKDGPALMDAIDSLSYDIDDEFRNILNEYVNSLKFGNSEDTSISYFFKLLDKNYSNMKNLKEQMSSLVDEKIRQYISSKTEN